MPRSEKVFQIHNDYKVAHDSFPNRFLHSKKIVDYFSHFAMRNACFYDYRYMMFYTHTWSQTHYIIKKKSLKYYKTIDLQMKLMLYLFSSFYFFIFKFQYNVNLWSTLHNGCSLSIDLNTLIYTWHIIE